MPARPIAITAITAIAALLVCGCTEQDSPAPSPPASDASDASDPSEAASPSPSASQAGATVPTDCRTLVSPAVYDATFGDTPLNDPLVLGELLGGVVQPKTPPDGATPEEVLDAATQLNCIWRDPRADITYLQAKVGRVDPAVASQYLDGLTAEGFTCTDAHGGTVCQRITKNEQYPVDDARTEFLRDDVHIFVGQSNFPTNDLIGSMVETIWP